MKKFICNTLIIILLSGVFCDAYFTISQLSSGRVWLADSEVYAADVWESVTQDDLVTAFRYYCKSRNLTIDGSIADALTSFTTSTFNNICSTLGIDVTSLQADLKKTVEGNLGLRFLMNQQGVLAYNRIFAEFLQNYDLSVGDQVDNQTVFSGDWFVDDDGYGCYVYVINGTDASFYDIPNPKIVKYGTPYRFNGLEYYNSYPLGTSSYTFNFNGTSISYTIENILDSSYKGCKVTNFGTNWIYREPNKSSLNTAYQVGNLGIFLYNGKLYRGRYTKGAYLEDKSNFVTESISITSSSPIADNDDDLIPDNINITTNNNTINNNTYNNNWTIIYNDGDTYISDDDDEPGPTTPPDGGGGGGGGDDPSDPLDPYDPNKPFPDTPNNPTPSPGITDQPGSDGTITIPDFNFDLPDINWSLDGLHKKFPFSLPFDLYNACKLLDAEPETPELDYTIDLVVYQWPVNYDLHWLDPAARVIRIFELLAFVVGLILITRKMLGD